MASILTPYVSGFGRLLTDCSSEPAVRRDGSINQIIDHHTPRNINSNSNIRSGPIDCSYIAAASDDRSRRAHVRIVGEPPVCDYDAARERARNAVLIGTSASPLALTRSMSVSHACGTAPLAVVRTPYAVRPLLPKLRITIAKRSLCARVPATAWPHRHAKCVRFDLDAELQRTCRRCSRTILAAEGRSDNDPSELGPAAGHSRAK